MTNNKTFGQKTHLNHSPYVMRERIPVPHMFAMALVAFGCLVWLYKQDDTGLEISQENSIEQTY